MSRTAYPRLIRNDGIASLRSSRTMIPITSSGSIRMFLRGNSRQRVHSYPPLKAGAFRPCVAEAGRSSIIGRACRIYLVREEDSMSIPTTETLSSSQIKELTTRYTYGTWRRQKGWAPIHIVDAEDCHFVDSDGKRYLDFSAQLMCVTLGHKNGAVVRAIQEQAEKLAYIGPGYATAVRAQLSQLLTEVLPQGLNKFFFTTSGTEANEAAFKIARMVTGKTKIISRYRSYHGSTMGSIAATGDPRRWAMEPAGKIPGVIFAPEVNCYKCPLLHEYPGCGIACVEYIEHMIANESDVAAVIIEPVVGTNGVLIPPKEYLPRLREICNQHEGLLIADEVMTGWCRTGKWFAVNHWGVVPDILTTAKGITNAAIPLGLCATS